MKIALYEVFFPIILHMFCVQAVAMWPPGVLPYPSVYSKVCASCRMPQQKHALHIQLLLNYKLLYGPSKGHERLHTGFIHCRSWACTTASWHDQHYMHKASPSSLQQHLWTVVLILYEAEGTQSVRLPLTEEATLKYSYIFVQTWEHLSVPLLRDSLSNTSTNSVTPFEYGYLQFSA